MTNKFPFLIALIALVAFSCQSADDGWKKLIVDDGISGWKVLGGQGLYNVENGEVIGTTKGTSNTFLATEVPYENFILELEVLVDPKMNSGIQFRSNQNAKGAVNGYQAEIDPSERAWSGGLYDESRRGWLYPLTLNESGRKAFKNNQWNKYRIEAYQNNVQIWVNNVMTTHFQDSMATTGFIALQVHGVGTSEEEGLQVKWRNIRLKEQIELKDLSEPLQGVQLINLSQSQTGG
ncbi:3-keto-disaccharide hydrolase [Roseivirga sp.]|uniref:3-keto-disaccharide hydrolase n=1 Tax=Roseivirga sp. TaxID=1964215 RepID=UPI003B8BB013